MNLARCWGPQFLGLGESANGRYSDRRSLDAEGVMAALRWEVCLRRVGPGDGSEPIASASLLRPGGAEAKPANFGLALQEARVLLGALQRAVVQDQVNAYDAYRRPCLDCGRYRRIKEWRPRVFDTALGTVRVRVPRVLACLCEPEPLDEDGEVAGYPVAWLGNGLLERRQCQVLSGIDSRM